MKNRTAKTVSLLAFVATATALLYRPTARLVQRLSARRRAAQGDDVPRSGAFANHYLGSKRHHSREGKRHPSTH